MSKNEELLERRKSLSPAKQALLERLRSGAPALNEKLDDNRRIPKRSNENPALLSFAQHRIWFLDQLDGGNPAYNIPAVFRLSGRLDVAGLERSLNEVVRRHEVLRTVFADSEGKPLQVVLPTLTLSVPLIDLQACGESDRDGEVLRRSTAEASRPFDLSRGPLLRATLLRVAEEEHILLLTMHHIISDGWSMGVFFRELAALYTAFSAGRPSPLPELPIQYADFSQWQRQWLQGDVLDQQLKYWTEKLKDIAPALDLPTDRLRPASRRFRGAQRSVNLPETLTRKLKAFSQAQGVTLFMTLLAAFQTLLHRYTRQDDIPVGSPIANRTRAEIEQQMGFFVNTLVLRTDFSGNPTFIELLRRVRETCLEAYAYQDLPFEKLVEELQPERDRSRSPLFEVMFQLRSGITQAPELPNITVEELEFDAGIAKFDLTLLMVDEAENLKSVWEYDKDLFDASTIDRMAGHFHMLLEGIAVDPERPVGELPLLQEVERRQLLTEWNQTDTDYPEHTSIHRLFETQAQRTPDAIAVVFEDQRLTYRELNIRANQLARKLRALDVGPEVLVGICVERSPTMVVGLLGILKAGGTYVPLDPAYPYERLAFICEDAQVSVLLTQQHLLSRLPKTDRPVLCLDALTDTISEDVAEKPINETTADHVAYIIYTSGSTGRPKGVAITHRSAVSFLTWAGTVFSPAELAGVLASTSICFDLSVFELFVPLTAGGKVILADSILQLPALTEAREVRLINTVPSAMAELLRADGIPATIRTVNLAGELLTTSLVQQIYQHTNVERVYDLYGPSEDTTYSTYALRRSDGESTIGRPIANTQVYLLDRHMQPVPVGIPGELYIGGAGLARGYLDRPEITAERFLPNPFSVGPDARMYRTGDLARYLTNGNIQFLGRIDYQVKMRGFRIELGEIEAVLRQHPMIQDGVVVTREDTPGDKRLVAYLVCRQEQQLNMSAVTKFLQQKLPAHMVPSVLMVMSSLPLTPNGKIDRRSLPAPGHARPALEGAFVAPRSSLEATVADCWALVLQLEQIGVDDNFFELGGHSLLATQLLSRLRAALKVEIPLRCLFEAPTVAGLAQRIEQSRQVERRLEVPPVSPVTRNGPASLSFGQERLWFLDRWEHGSMYNIPAVFRLSGRLDVAGLERSLNEVVRRHEVLRTVFVDSEGKPQQVVLPTLTLSVPLINLQASGESDRDGEVLRRSTAEASRPFDLSRGPLLRATLLRVAEEEHILLLTMHHIISDGWSMGVFFRELAALYTAFSAGRPSPLPELPIQYADFSQWQRQWLQGDILDQQLEYWTEKLKDIVNLDLPVDQVRPRLQTHRGAHQSVTLKTTCSEGLKKLSRQEGVTMFMTLLAAFKTLLHRYSGQDDIVVGCPIANRNRAEIEGLIGFFVNTLVLRTDLSGNPTFVELLDRVRETALGAYAHQDLPFEKLLEKLQPERDTSRSPLVQVLFNFLNFTETRLALGDLSLSRLKVGDGETAKFDLTFYVEEVKSGLTVTANYNTDLFDAATISRLLGHFQALLEEIVRTPTQRLSAIPLAVPVEQQRPATSKQRVGPANPFVVFSKAEIEQSIPDRFVKQVKQYPQNIAVKTPQGAWSYDALNKWANRIARTLLAVCLNKEERIALLFDHGATMIAGLLAVLKAGKTYTPLDPSYPKERLIYMLDELQAEVILTDGKDIAFAKDLQEDARCLINVEDIPANVEADDPPVSIPPDSLAYILYTSGSTGRPKGVMQTHHNVLHHMRSYTNSLHICEKDRLTLISSYGFDAAVMDIFGALLNGATIYPVDVKEHGVSELVRWLRNERISIYHSTPTVYRYLFGSLSADESLADLRLVVLGGEEVNKRDVDMYKARFSSACLLVNGLGPTESTLALQYFIDKQTEIPRLSVPVGFPVEETDILLLDGAGKPAPVIGEIAIRSPHIALGYWRQPDLTQAVFRSDQGTGSARIYHTGDMGRMRSDGSIEFVGRKDHQVKIRGFRIELGEIESVLVQHPAVRETAVIQREDRTGDKRLVAYIVPSQNHSSTPIELRAFLKARLPDYMIPSAFIFLDSLPLTPNGKLDRAAFPAPGPSRPEMEETYLAPRTAVEKKLAAIWREILKLERVGIHDDFFALGGHSLLATQVMSRVSDAFEVELPLRSLFETPTVAGLAAQVMQGRGKNAVPVEITEILTGVESLSDEEAEHLLSQESPPLPRNNTGRPE